MYTANMLQPKKNNVAYIDGANLHKGSELLGWRLDYRRLRIWLSDKYHVHQAYLFLGYISKYKSLYIRLQEAGFTLVFKDVIYDGNGKVKGNCDADLVVRVMRDVYEHTFDEVIIVSSDGDYAGLVGFLLEKKKLKTILSPAISSRCSILLKRTGASIAYINDQQSILSETK